ncbi:hypothetical protein IC607_08685 [Cellulomonas sp. JH27-2]|uniref:hypothetical protein n=1 Tax=Cellulomonas sp. JH27-2 TaxID=2774139 RepID=UPI0017855698|nr:hypothetical protein [Cellulomonas sp. JH27-2]MBD8059043.1 hypothetical protein [Cellulomonas sp. JH27-2]
MTLATSALRTSGPPPLDQAFTRTVDMRAPLARALGDLAGITNVVRLTDELRASGENRGILRFDPVVFDPAALAERAREFRVDGWKARVDLTLRPSEDLLGWLVPAADVTVLDGDGQTVTGFSVTAESRHPMDVDRLESSLVRAVEGYLWTHGLACAHDLKQVGERECQPDGSVVVPYSLDVYPDDDFDIHVQMADRREDDD